MTAQITVLRPRDRLRQDATPVAAMYRDLGTSAAEQVVTRALGDLALTMSGLSARVRQHDLGDLSRQLRRLQAVADQLGLVSLGLVANDVRACLDRADTTAFAAVWARLLRVAELSLGPDQERADRQL